MSVCDLSTINEQYCKITVNVVFFSIWNVFSPCITNVLDCGRLFADQQQKHTVLIRNNKKYKFLL